MRNSLLAVISSLLASCAITTNSRNDDTLLRSTTRSAPNVTWTYAAKAAAKADDLGMVHVRVAVTRSGMCKLLGRVVDRTVVTERQWAPSIAGWRTWDYVLGAAGVALLGYTGYQLGQGDSLTESSMSSSGTTVSTTGDAAIAGVALTSLLVAAVVTDIRARDSREHVGETSVEDLGPTCTEPAANLHVKLVTRGPHVAIEGDTSRDGVLEADVDAQEFASWDLNTVAIQVGEQLTEVDNAPLFAARDAAVNVAHAAAQVQADQLSDDETRQAKCLDGRIRSLQAALQAFKTIIESDEFILNAQTIDVATPSGAVLSVTTPLAGEYHVLVAAYSKVTVDASNEKGQQVTLTSPYVRIPAANNWYSASRVLQGNAGEEFKIRVKGSGCFLLMSFKRY